MELKKKMIRRRRLADLLLGEEVVVEPPAEVAVEDVDAESQPEPQTLNCRMTVLLSLPASVSW